MFLAIWFCGSGLKQFGKFRNRCMTLKTQWPGSFAWWWRWCPFYLFQTGYSYLFWANLVQKIKIASLSWKLVLRLIRIWRIQCSFFMFSTRSILFFWKFVLKIKITCWSWNLEPRLIRICRIWWWFSLF